MLYRSRICKPVSTLYSSQGPVENACPKCGIYVSGGTPVLVPVQQVLTPLSHPQPGFHCLITNPRKVLRQLKFCVLKHVKICKHMHVLQSLHTEVCKFFTVHSNLYQESNLYCCLSKWETLRNSCVSKARRGHQDASPGKSTCPQP